MNTIKTQLEMSFEAPVKFTRTSSRQRRMVRAHWWFQQMHTVVERAFDWSTAPAPPPEQIHLTLAKTH